MSPARVGSYEIVAPIGAGGHAVVRARIMMREIWRGLAVAKEART